MSEIDKLRYRRHPLRSTHNTMLARCGYRKGCYHDRKWYADKGITVCDEWRHFKAFEEWAMANGWRRGLQVDRIDPSVGYCPQNCRLVTPLQNARNRSNNRLVVFGGETVCVSEAMEKSRCALTKRAVLQRLNKGWSVEDSLLTPARKKKGER